MTAGLIDWSSIWRDMAIAAETGRRMQAVSVASLDVIAARLGRFGAAISRGVSGDFSEQARWLPEKTAAFSDAGAIVVAAWWDGQGLLSTQVKQNADLLLRRRPPTAAELAEFWQSSSVTGLRLLGVAVRCGRDALTPIETVVAANRRRLMGNDRPAPLRLMRCYLEVSVLGRTTVARLASDFQTRAGVVVDLPGQARDLVELTQIGEAAALVPIAGDLGAMSGETFDRVELGSRRCIDIQLSIQPSSPGPGTTLAIGAVVPI